MSELSKLCGKGKEFEIGGIKLNIKPLSLSDMDLMTEMAKEGADQQKASKEIIKKVLKDAVPDSTDEEIENVSVEYMPQLMEAISEVNNLNTGNESDVEYLKKIKEQQDDARRARENRNKKAE